MKTLKNTLTLLLFIFPLLVFSQVITEKTQFKIDSIENLLSTQNNEDKLTSHFKLISLYMRPSPDTAKLYIDSLKVNAQKLGNEDMVGHTLRGLGQYYYEKSDFNSAEDTYLKAIKKFDSLDNKMEVSQIYNLLGITQRIMGKLDKAAESHIQSIKLAEENGATGKRLAGPYFNVGSLFTQLKNYDKAKEYYNKAGKISEEINFQSGIYLVKSNLAIVNKLEGNYDEAITGFEEAAVYFRNIKDYKSLGSSLNNLAGVYMKIGNNAKARTYYNETLEFTKTKGQPQLVGLLHRNIGEIDLEEGNYKSALRFFKISKDYSEQTGNDDRLLDDYEYIGKAYAGLGRYKDAYENRLVFYKMYDSLYQIKRVAAIEELETKYETEKKEAEIALQEEEIKTLNAQTENDKLTKTLYGIGMFSFLAIAGLLYFGFKQRMKKNKIEREKQEAIYKQEIDFKKKELASQTLHLVQKNTFIQELKKNLEKIKKSPELFKVEFRRLVMLLKKESAEDKDWEVFKSYFSEVHNNFDNKIKAIAQDISEKEIRLASFLRMNLSTKEIASMLNVLPDSVLKSKYRLKQKLKLSKEQDLTQFLNTL